MTEAESNTRDDSTTAASGPQEGLSSPETLISNAIEALRNAEGTDIDLLDILSRHIVTMNPAGSAIADAMTDIEALAAKRAGETNDDGANHD